MNGFWRLLAYPVWLYWLYPRGGRWGRTFSLWFFLASIYYMCAPKCPWYVPPYALVGMIAWGFMIAELAPRLAVRREGVPPPAVSPSLVLLGGVILAVGLQARTCLQMAARDRLHQSIIEDRVRRPVGLWLHQHAQPKDTVFLEPLGYLGYYSNLKVYDFPGLASREVVTARRTLGTNNYDALIKALRPDWLVLRPREVITIRAASPGLLSEGGPGIYNLVQFFDQAEAVGALAGLPGVSTLRYDQTFLIYQRAH